MRGQRAFTLIEVLVAVAVLGIAMGAVISGMARYASNAAYMKEKSLAIIVAHNQLTELSLEPGWPSVGGTDGSVEMAGIDWRWHLDVSETPDPTVRRADIEVEIEGREQTLASLSAFLTDKP